MQELKILIRGAFSCKKLALIFSVLVFLCGHSSISKASEELVLVVPEYPPYQYTENGVAKGFKLDLLREATKRSGYKLKVIFRPWARVLKMVESGQADFTNMYKTPEREETYYYSNDVLFPITIRFFSKRESDITFDGNFEKLSDYKIGVVNKVSYGKKFDMAVETGILKNIEPTNNHENLISLLNKGRIDLAIGATYVLDSVIKQEGLTQTIVGLHPALSDANVYNAFTRTRDMSQVSEDLDKALQSMREDGIYTRIILNAFLPTLN